jgi:hypothetical protein
MTKLLAGFYIAILCFLISSCTGIDSPKTANTPTVISTSELTTVPTTETSTPNPTDTQTLTPAPSPSFTPSSTPTFLPSATPALPAYYLPHPALVPVAPPGYWFIQWIDDTHAAFWMSSKPREEWDEYLIPEDSSEIRYLKQTVIEETRTNNRDSSSMISAAVDSFHIPGEIFTGKSSISPNGQKLLIITLTEQPTATLKLGNRNISPYENLYFEGWVVDLVGQKAQALFYTPEDFAYFWVDDNQYVLATSFCYGGGENAGQGSFSINAQTLKISGLGDNYGGPCEGGRGPEISPDALHIIFQNDHGTVETMMGTQRVHICQSGYPRSYGWSPDSRYVFVACARSYDQPDELRRYDTQTGKISILTDRNKIPFKAIDLVVSPDQTRILFQWSTTDFGVDEPYGIWLLDLQKLDN